MHKYAIRDVEKLLRLSRSTIRALVGAGFVTPARGPRNTWLFSFQDMIVLRTAQALSEAKVPAKRITRSLKELRSQLPETMPLSGLSIGAVGEHVVVRDGTGQRRAESGQYLLAFEGDPASGRLSVIERQPVEPPPADTQALFEYAADLELDDPAAAIRAYEQVIAADPERLDARINLGRLLHESGRLAQAERVYRDAIKAGDGSALLHYNLGVLLDDMDRAAEALESYQAALKEDPALADGYYNLSLVCRKLDKPREAIRYMSQYRRLVGVQAE